MKLKRMKKRCLAAVVGASVMVGLLTGCGSTKAEKMSTAIHVDVQTAEPGRLEIKGRYMGVVSPNEAVNVTPMASGTVTKVYVKEGDRVKEGDLLCQFDDTAAQLSVDSAKGAVASARAGKKAAKEQQEMAEEQSKSGITTLEDTLDAYEKSLKKAKKQMEELKDAQGQLKTAMEQAQTGLTAAKTKYKTAETLYVNYKAFLTANPDCQTTAGLTAAMTAAGEDGAAAEKAQGAAALANALNSSGLTVEYLSDTGLNSLKGNVEDAEKAYTAASGSYGETESGIATLKSSVETLKTQIKSTKSSLKSAKKSQPSGGGSSDAVYDAQIRSAQVGVDSAEYQKELCTVKAPIDGVVEAVNVTANEMAGTGMPAFVIAGSDSILVTFYVPENVRNFLQVGDAVEAEHNGKILRGTISSVAVAVDAQKGLFQVEAQLFSGENMPATGVSVALSVVTAASEEEVLVPYDAVYYENNQAYVYCVQDGKAVRTDVVPGLYDEESMAIESGLEEGDRVIVSWAAGLKNGAEIAEGTEGTEEESENGAVVQDDEE
ncbi:MAG: efflux RND transporter periplasmic adaptor subunit [Eubacteriales bacterium]|nr:efflux RND transporter periplasmic adaptor subunit [Eubacteriales bacterium]